jgi:hypothetical protein
MIKQVDDLSKEPQVKRDLMITKLSVEPEVRLEFVYSFAYFSISTATCR